MHGLPMQKKGAFSVARRAQAIAGAMYLASYLARYLALLQVVLQLAISLWYRYWFQFSYTYMLFIKPQPRQAGIGLAQLACFIKFNLLLLPDLCFRYSIALIVLANSKQLAQYIIPFSISDLSFTLANVSYNYSMQTSVSCLMERDTESKKQTLNPSRQSQLLQLVFSDLYIFNQIMCKFYELGITQKQQHYLVNIDQ